jgi:hypothetical protein
VVAPPSPDPVPASFVATGPLLLPLLLVAELLLLVAPPVAPDVPELPLLAVESPLALVPALDEAVNVLEALPCPVSLEALELELLSLASGTLLFELHAASAQHTKPRPTFLASVVLVRMIYSFS